MFGIGEAIGGVLGYLGQREANDTNARMAQDANKLSEAESQRNRNFQEAMSATAYQRAVIDLKKAGLNPMLAAGSPASSPSGAQASGVAGRVENAIAPAITGAMEVNRASQAMKLQEKNIESINEDIKLKKAQTAETGMRTTVMSKDLPKAEIINEAYNAGKRILENVKGIINGTGARDTRNLESYKKGMKNWPKVDLNKP